MIFVSLQSYKQSKIHLCDFKLFHALIVSLFSFFFKGGGGGGGGTLLLSLPWNATRNDGSIFFLIDRIADLR